MDQQTEKKPRRVVRRKKKWYAKLTRFVFSKVGLLCILCIGIFAGGGIVSIGLHSQTEHENKVVDMGFSDMSELATQAVRLTMVNVTTDARQLFDITIPFTQSKYIYSYDVEIQAGYDFSKVKWDADEKKQTITVTLPEVHIVSSGLDLASLKIYHEQESIFQQITLQETNDANLKMEQDAISQALDSGLYDNARNHAEEIIRAMFESQPVFRDYSIVFTEEEA